MSELSLSGGCGRLVSMGLSLSFSGGCLRRVSIGLEGLGRRRCVGVGVLGARLGELRSRLPRDGVLV